MSRKTLERCWYAWVNSDRTARFQLGWRPGVEIIPKYLKALFRCWMLQGGFSFPEAYAALKRIDPEFPYSRSGLGRHIPYADLQERSRLLGRAKTIAERIMEADQ